MGKNKVHIVSKMNANPTTKPRIKPLPTLIRPDTWLAQAWYAASCYTDQPYIGRFAPSPSGVLHQGSLIAALASYLHADWHGGRWLLRMEDVDQSRCTRALGAQQLNILRALGFEWDTPVLWQTERFAAYRAAFAPLKSQGRIYPCACTRKQIVHRENELNIQVYPRTCRGVPTAPEKIHSWRFDVGEQIITWTDESGRVTTENLSATCGDFVVRRGFEATDDWAYQWAVVVDDAWQGVTHVVRGADLWDSTARQIALQQALNAPLLQYSHMPLLVNEAGEKLSKSGQAPALDVLAPTDALLHAWEFLGGQRFDCALPEDFFFFFRAYAP